MGSEAITTTYRKGPPITNRSAQSRLPTCEPACVLPTLDTPPRSTIASDAARNLTAGPEYCMYISPFSTSLPSYSRVGARLVIHSFGGSALCIQGYVPTT